MNSLKPKPSWLKKSLPKGGRYQKMQKMLSLSGLHTICQKAKCPNMFECFSHNTATFMILGDHCTRNCGFCNVASAPPCPVDPDEPAKVAEAVLKLGLFYIVVTSVTRDDLPDGGAFHFAAVIKAVKQALSDAKIEVLIPDFKGNRTALRTVLDAGPCVLNHNIETVRALYPAVRPQADYQQSLDLIKRVKMSHPGIVSKSGLMVGLGENLVQIEKTFDDLVKHGCDMVTIGQYLAPSISHLPVEKYYTPLEFEVLEKKAIQAGFKKVASGPFVRSSYNAGHLFDCCSHCS